MTRGNYQRWEQGQRGLRPSQAQVHARSTKSPRSPRQIVALRVGLLTSRKVAKPLQIHSVGRVTTAERGSFEGHYFWDHYDTQK